MAVRNAIQKYGWEKVEKEWYEVPDEDLNFYEEMLVALLGTLSPGGYNLKEGGGNGKPSEESRQKMSEAKTGEKHPMYGKEHTEESKQKMSEAKTGEKNSNSKKVYQYKLDGTYVNEFYSSGEAARALEKNNGSKIRSCACGDRKTAYGFKWSYTEL